MPTIEELALSVVQTYASPGDDHIDRSLERKEALWSHLDFYQQAHRMSDAMDVKARLGRVRVWLAVRQLKKAVSLLIVANKQRDAEFAKALVNLLNSVFHAKAA